MSWSTHVRAPMGGGWLDVAIDGAAGVTAVLGPNGSGKSTLLRVLAGIHPVERGVVRIGAQRVFDHESGRCVPPEGRRVGYVPQGFGLFPHLDVLDNVAFGLGMPPRRMARTARRARAQEVLQQLDAGALAPRSVTGLSGGEAQRVALARALAVEPALLLLDEPLAALDVRQRRRVRSYLVAHLRRLALPCVLVTHDLDDLDGLEAHCVVLEAGRVVQEGTTGDLRASPATAFVQALSPQAPLPPTTHDAGTSNTGPA